MHVCNIVDPLREVKMSEFILVCLRSTQVGTQ